MELSPALTYDCSGKINDADTVQSLVPYLPPKGPANFARGELLKRRKPIDKDPLLALKLDPAVLEAQVTLTKTDEDPWHSSALAAEMEARDERNYPSFEAVLSMQAALLGLSSQQLTLLIGFIDALRRQTHMMVSSDDIRVPEQQVHLAAITAAQVLLATLREVDLEVSGVTRGSLRDFAKK